MDEITKPKHPGGRPLKFDNALVLIEQVNQYFLQCDNKKEPYTITGLALALDTDRSTLIEYESGKYDDPDKTAELNQQFSYTIKRAKQKCQHYAEKHLFTSPSVTGAIFNLKNNYGWVDKHETDITSDGKELNLLVYKPEKYADPDDSTTDVAS